MGIELFGGASLLGMRRAGMSRDAIADVREAYKTLYDGSVVRQSLAQLLRDRAQTDAGRLVADFMAESSTRGLAQRARIRHSG